MSSSSSRPDNVSVAAEPAKSQSTSATSSMISDEALSDQAWAQAKYLNFRLFVRSLVPQEPKLAEWADWLDKLPLAVFLAGGDGELRGSGRPLTKPREGERQISSCRGGLCSTASTLIALMKPAERSYACT